MQEQDRETARLSNGQLATLRELATDLERIVWEVSTRDGDATARQQLRAEAVRAAYEALASPLSAPPQEPTGDSPQADVTCEHGTAMDVHCCNCHSGFIFDVNHECPSPELTWREAVEQALGVANDPENHTPSWAFDVVMAAREIGNAPSPASPQAETREDMGDGWYVTVGRWAESIVTIEQRSLSGKADLTDDDAALIRGAAKHLQAFIGQPVWPTPEPETCEWRREVGNEYFPLNHDDASGQNIEDLQVFAGCPYCLKPLRLSQEPR